GSRLVGMIYDARQQIQYVEIRGHCTVDDWRGWLTGTLGRDTTIQELTVKPIEVAGRLDHRAPLQDLQDFEEVCFGRRGG
ncbi:MAG: hypothetical protein AAF989_16095, partial [Planctomycetota bacterium]